MQLCECVCRYRNSSNKYTMYDLRLENGSVVTLSSSVFVKALSTNKLRCTNVQLTGRSTLYAIGDNIIPTISKKLTPELAKEVDAFVQISYSRYKLAGIYANLEDVFDNFLTIKCSQGTVYSPLVQYCIYEHMNNLRSWDIYTTYAEENGTIALTSTLVSEGIFTLRCFVRAVHGRRNKFGSPFPVEIGQLKVINQSSVTNMAGLFSSINAKMLDLSEFKTNVVTDMSYMFYSCIVESLDLHSFNTSKVTNMERMFAGCAELKWVDIKSFDTRKVTNMSGLFLDCDKLRNMNLHNFDTSQVTNMSSTFYNCDLRTWNISSLDTSNVTDMSEMFRGGILIGTEMQNFNTSNVISFRGMFWSCGFYNRKCELSSFNTSKVSDFSSMFRDCASMTEINLDSFSFKSATDVTSMFDNCQGLSKLELNFGYCSLVYASDLCIGCHKLETLTLRGIDFSGLTHFEHAILFCSSLKWVNLECKNFDMPFMKEILTGRAKRLRDVNLKGSDAGSIKRALVRVERERLAIKIHR